MVERISCVVGTAGHIDHGKTSLVRALTGMDTDTLADEKKRGISIDLGFAHMGATSGARKVRIAFVDVPGHERFIKNMLSGATGMGSVLFAVAADDGVMPQTIEHLRVVLLLGVGSAVFAITKTDVASKDRVAEVRADIRRLVAGTRFVSSPVIPVSVVTGAGLDELTSAVVTNAVSSAVGDEGGFFRLPVDRSFAVKGFGTVVTGTIASGGVKKGDELVCYPSGRVVKVRGVQCMHEEVDSVFRGHRAALNLSGVSRAEVSRGEVVVDKWLAERVGAGAVGKWRVDAFVEFFDHGVQAGKKRRLTLHHHTSDASCVVETSAVALPRKSGEVPARLVLASPLLMLSGDRFILRDASTSSTVGGGTVVVAYMSFYEAPQLNSTSVFKAETKEELTQALVNDAGFVVESDASIMLNAMPAVFGRLLANPASAIKRIGSFLASVSAAAAFEKRAVESIVAYTLRHPGEVGMPEERFTAVLRRLYRYKAMNANLLKALIDSMCDAGRLSRNGALVSFSGGKTAGEKHATTGALAVDAAVLAVFAARAVFVAVDMSELMRLGFAKTDVDKAASRLQKSGAIARLTEKSFLSGESIAVARERLTGLMTQSGGVTAAAFRDCLGCGRKLAIEILEYFDRERVTLRKGDLRVLR